MLNLIRHHHTADIYKPDKTPCSSFPLSVPTVPMVGTCTATSVFGHLLITVSERNIKCQEVGKNLTKTSTIVSDFS